MALYKVHYSVRYENDFYQAACGASMMDYGDEEWDSKIIDEVNCENCIHLLNKIKAFMRPKGN